MPPRYALDTNVLVALAYADHPQHLTASSATRRLAAGGAGLCFTPQNLGEFWNVSTRPREKNGFGLSPEETLHELSELELKCEILVEGARVYHVWKHLLTTYGVRGIQVHDAHLAAVLQVHGVRSLLTFNAKDFQRFPAIHALHPSTVEA